jgi:hypothetical protein
MKKLTLNNNRKFMLELNRDQPMEVGALVTTVERLTIEI